MMSRAQQIRVSQFVITYGPGAILETRKGPKVILSPDKGLQDCKPKFEKFEKLDILDERMNELIKYSHNIQPNEKVGIFRIPSNAELGMPEDRYIYRTKDFPEWRLCGPHDDSYILFRGRRCPKCGPGQGPTKQPAVRFITICPKGHMDDVNWHVLVHGTGNQVCDTGYYIWKGTGSLSQIKITCPRCWKSKSLGEAYNEDFECSGRRPELESIDAQPYSRPVCNARSKIVQRQASNVRIPELRTLFTIPPAYTMLHKLLKNPYIDGWLSSGRDRIESMGMEDFKQGLDNLVSLGRITPAVRDDILAHNLEEIKQAVRDNLSPIPSTYSGLLDEEFHALLEGSEKGIPPIRGLKPISPPLIEVNPYLVKDVQFRNNVYMRIVPVHRLRSVTVQIGYRRVISQVDADVVDISFYDPESGTRWYPGIDLFGEGLFIILDGNEGWHFELKGEHSREWMNAFNGNPREIYKEYMFRDGKRIVELHPAFVWWHTLAHLLIRSVASEAGYSSSSIRERVYLEVEGDKARGGILLYAVQPGSDGTFGGLIALTHYFERILESALDLLMSCSCDPLCIETRFERGMVNGAACYGCLLLSETSCEHRNMWLDRNVLLESIQ